MKNVSSWAISLGLACAFVACRAEDVANTNSIQAKALPIRGSFLAYHIKGHLNVGLGGSLSAGTDTLMPFEKTFPDSDAMTVDFDIDAEGHGVLKSFKRCEIVSLKPSNAQPANFDANLNIADKGMLLKSVYDLLVTTASDVECSNNPTKLVAGSISTYRASNFFGGSDPKLWKNLGVMGEEKNIGTSEKECLGMRGVRYMSVGTGRACIGFTDSSANNLKMILVRAGDIYAQRILLRRKSER